MGGGLRHVANEPPAAADRGDLIADIRIDEDTAQGELTSLLHQIIEYVPRRRNLWVTDAVEGCRESQPAYPLPDGEGFGSFPSQLLFEPV